MSFTTETTRNAAAATVATLRAVRLTSRELEVIKLGAGGASSAEIADELFVSKRTVDFHWANIFDKLDVNNRVKALNAARRLGLLPFSPI